MVLSISVNKHDEMPTFIIENPEIHLHPSAQLYLMEFLLFMSKYCQFIIETHSDYIIKETLGNINTQIIKLKNNFIPEIYDKSKGHILPTLSLAEIQWTAFDMPTIDFHILLYSYLLIKLKVKTNGFDDKIRKTKSFKKNKDNYETNYPAFKKRNNQKETLPTFLRNLIHHPESDRKVNIKKGDFDLKLRVSIQLLIDIIKELKL